jgi:dTDP-glucose pyrophosphorylase/predicted transcriptional regulator
MPHAFEKALLSQDKSILDAIKIIDLASLQIVLIVDENKTLKGTITDGDIRRGILNGTAMSECVQKIMNKTPHSVPEGTSRQEMLDIMTEHTILQLPIIDNAGRIVGLAKMDELAKKARIPKENFDDVNIVLMLGGLGSRLLPLTENTPKPMIEIGGRPLLETILENFTSQGFKNFYFSVNYKSDIIKDHFGDGTPYGANITYLHEDQRLGTAGALSLIKETPKGPIIVMNGDILTNTNFAHLVSFHRQNKAEATMCVREYEQQVPYGVIENAGTKLQSITEKPSQTYFVNAGIYVVEPDTLSHVPQNEYFDMPDLFNKIESAGKESSVYPIREYWLDIGNLGDLEKGREEYNSIFKTKNAAAE